MIIKKRTKGVIKTDYGIKDYYKYFKENNPDLNIDYKTYTNIIYDFNKEIVDMVINDNLEYNIPYIGSTLSIRKDKRVPKIVNGKLYNTAPVDWKATKELWTDDEDAMSKKLLVRHLNHHTSKYVFRIYFKKYNLYFKNKQLFSFKATRSFQRALSARIKDDTKQKYDSYLLY